MFAAIGTALALVLHLFNEFVNKHAIDLQCGECLPRRWIAWGRYDVGQRHEVSYFHLYLPSYEWCLDYRRLRWGFARRVLCWSNTHGWEINYLFTE